MENGIYRARPLEAVLTYTAAGNEQVHISFELLDDGFEGKYLTYFGSFSEKAQEHTFKALRNCGWTGVDLSDLSGLNADEVSLVVENEEYEGKVRAKVRWVNAPGGVTVKAPLPPDKAKAFAARMKGQLLAFDKTSTAPKPAVKATNSRQPEPPPHDDTDRPPV